MVVALRAPMAEPGRHLMVDTFEKTPHTLMDQVRSGDLSTGDAFAYIALAQIAYTCGGEVNLPQEALARAVGCKARTLRLHLSTLIEKHWVIERKLGLGRACAYTPVIPVGPRNGTGAGTRPSGSFLPLDPKPEPVQVAKNCRSSGSFLPFEWQKTATPLIQTPEQTPEDVNGTTASQPVPAPAREQPSVAVVQATTAKPLLPVPKPTPRPAAARVDTTEPSPEPSQASPRKSPPPPPPDPDVEELWAYYRLKIQPGARTYKPALIAARLKTFTVDELKAGIDHFAADWWWMETNAGAGANWLFRSDEQVERFVNLRPRAAKGSEHAAVREGPDGVLRRKDGTRVNNSEAGARLSPDVVAIMERNAQKAREAKAARNARP